MLTPISGAVTAPRGFKAAAVNCGIKPASYDLTLILSERPAVAAATVTTNTFRAAPTYVTQEAVANGVAQAVVVNSGCANAATGDEGLRNARQMGRLAAEALGVAVEDVIVCSTGHIGDQLPMDKIASGVALAAAKLSAESGEEAARGIMTTDTVPKFAAVEFPVGGTTARMGGICKGAGMICPNMATMLCFITTDIAIEADLLRPCLQEAVERSFNCISVDGDMSTNDTVAILANGMAGNAPLTGPESEGFAAFVEALEYVTQTLAKKIAADGEGASKFIEIVVSGAQSWEQARMVGRGIANYSLVKTAMYGGDFNWGRIAAAIGATGVPIDTKQVTISIQGIRAWEGQVAPFDFAAGCKALATNEVKVEVFLGLGDASATVWTCDLTPEYVASNSVYDVGHLEKGPEGHG